MKAAVPPAPVGPPMALRMKFRPNDLSKYQMTMQATMQMPGMPQGSAPTYLADIRLVVQQKTIKMHPNGSADLAISTLSGSGTVNGTQFKPDIGGKPSIITFDTRNTVVSAHNLPKTASGGLDLAGQFFQSGALSTQGVYLPPQPVHVGDKWTTQKVNMSGLGSGAAGTVQTKLVRLETVGTFSTARLHSTLRVPFVMTDRSVKPAVTLKGQMTMNYDSNLALQEGKVVRSAGDGDITVTANVPGETGKSIAARNTGNAQKVTVKLRMGNNYIP